MLYRLATPADAPILAELNQQLIEDEGHRNRMSLSELAERMLKWIATDYQATIFQQESRILAYALYRDDQESIYLRQFFVQRDVRRAGYGRQCIQLLQSDVWPQNRRLVVDVLCHNAAGISFWRALGFADYCLALEINPEQNKIAERTGAANPHAFGTFGTSAAEQPLVPKASGDT